MDYAPLSLSVLACLLLTILCIFCSQLWRKIDDIVSRLGKVFNALTKADEPKELEDDEISLTQFFNKALATLGPKLDALSLQLRAPADGQNVERPQTPFNIVRTGLLSLRIAELQQHDEPPHRPFNIVRSGLLSLKMSKVHGQNDERPRQAFNIVRTGLLSLELAKLRQHEEKMAPEPASSQPPAFDNSQASTRQTASDQADSEVDDPSSAGTAQAQIDYEERIGALTQEYEDEIANIENMHRREMDIQRQGLEEAYEAHSIQREQDLEAILQEEFRQILQANLERVQTQAVRTVEISQAAMQAIKLIRNFLTVQRNLTIDIFLAYKFVEPLLLHAVPSLMPAIESVHERIYPRLASVLGINQEAEVVNENAEWWRGGFVEQIEQALQDLADDSAAFSQERLQEDVRRDPPSQADERLHEIDDDDEELYEAIDDLIDDERHSAEGSLVVRSPGPGAQSPPADRSPVNNSPAGDAPAIIPLGDIYANAFAAHDSDSDCESLPDADDEVADEAVENTQSQGSAPGELSAEDLPDYEDTFDDGIDPDIQAQKQPPAMQSPPSSPEMVEYDFESGAATAARRGRGRGRGRGGRGRR